MLINHGSHVKKAREAELTKLLADIQVLELKHKRSLVPAVVTELAHLHRQVSDLLRYKAKAALQSCKELMYESGDKCGKWLAWALRDQRRASYIPFIKGRTKTLLTHKSKAGH